MDAALVLLNHLFDPLATAEQRRTAEAWCASDAAWGWCAAALSSDQPHAGQLQLLVAQIMRHKLNTQGWQLPPEQLLQLRDLLLRRLHASAAGGALLSELLLCLVAVFLLLPSWSDPVETVCAALCQIQIARFLQLLAEEAGGDLRRVHLSETGGGWSMWTVHACEPTCERMHVQVYACMCYKHSRPQLSSKARCATTAE